MSELLPLEVSVQETQRRLTADGDKPRLVDVRDPDEYAYCHLPGSELIPLATLPSDATTRLPDRDEQILVYCHHGMRSARATEMLRQLGYKNAQSVAGGIDQWSKEIDPTVPVY